jgi:multidrug efflux pump subunit AcrA (membrane-fusion protein)
MSLDKAALESLRLDREPSTEHYEERGGWWRRWRWVVIGMAAIVVLVVGWRATHSAVAVKTVTVETPAANGAVLNASGYVVARRLATVSSKVTGRVNEVLFEEGAAVEAGQVLAHLDRSTVQAEYNVSAHNLVAARRNLDEIEVRLADAKRTLARNQSLVEKKLLAQSVAD